MLNRTVRLKRSSQTNEKTLPVCLEKTYKNLLDKVCKVNNVPIFHQAHRRRDYLAGVPRQIAIFACA